MSAGTCAFPNNWFGCDVGAVAPESVIKEDIKLECEVGAGWLGFGSWGLGRGLGRGWWGMARVPGQQRAGWRHACLASVSHGTPRRLAARLAQRRGQAVGEHGGAGFNRAVPRLAWLQGKEAGKCASNMNIR